MPTVTAPSGEFRSPLPVTQEKPAMPRKSPEAVFTQCNQTATGLNTSLENLSVQATVVDLGQEKQLMANLRTELGKLTLATQKQLQASSGDIEAENAGSPIVQSVDSGIPSGSDSSTSPSNLKDLINPRTYSKKHDQAGRNSAAAAISDVRAQVAEHRTRSKQITEELADNDKSQDQLYEQERSKTLSLRRKEAETLAKIRKMIHIPDPEVDALGREIADLQRSRQELEAKYNTRSEEQKLIQERQATLPDPKEIARAYYEKISTTPLTNEQKRELLKPESLANLSEGEYIALWRKLNPQFLSHVTRQGFRDHNGMVYHSSGLNAFHNGFENVMQDGAELRPPLALQGLRARDKASVQKYLESSQWVLEADNATIAKDRLDKLLNFTLAAAPKYPDSTAVHLAAQIVADGYYGGERDNEVFFVFPSDVLASQNQFAFNGGYKTFTEAQNETKWNDVFVWPNSMENPGIKVDSGIVFLPENTPVDQQTGSKYASEVREVDGKKQRVLTEDADLTQRFLADKEKWGGNQSPLKQAFERYQATRYEDQRNLLRRDCLDVFSKELQNFGFNPDAANILGRELFREMHAWPTFSDYTGPQISDSILRLR